MNRLYIFLMGSVLLVGFVSPVQAQSGGGYDLSWSTIDGGGGMSTGGGYTLSGTIGQPDAGILLNGSYTQHQSVKMSTNLQALTKTAYSGSNQEIPIDSLDGQTEQPNQQVVDDDKAVGNSKLSNNCVPLSPDDNRHKKMGRAGFEPT